MEDILVVVPKEVPEVPHPVLVPALPHSPVPKLLLPHGPCLRPVLTPQPRPQPIPDPTPGRHSCPRPTDLSLVLSRPPHPRWCRLAALAPPIPQTLVRPSALPAHSGPASGVRPPASPAVVMLLLWRSRCLGRALGRSLCALRQVLPAAGTSRGEGNWARGWAGGQGRQRQGHAAASPASTPLGARHRRPGGESREGRRGRRGWPPREGPVRVRRCPLPSRRCQCVCRYPLPPRPGRARRPPGERRLWLARGTRHIRPTGKAS